MRLSQTEKYCINSYIVILLIFIAGFAFAADPKKVESKYIEMSKGDIMPRLFLSNMLH